MTDRVALLLEQASAATKGQIDAQELRDAGRIPWLADDPDCPDVMRLAALTEELGEVARAVQSGDRENLRVELSQLAGIALAWGIVA